VAAVYSKLMAEGTSREILIDWVRTDLSKKWE